MNTKRNYAIDFLKLFFTLLIVLHHSTLINKFMVRGYIGVELFFIISGYLIMQTVTKHKDRTATSYAIGRVKQLYPHYLYSFVIMFLATSVYGNTSGFSIDEIISFSCEALMLNGILNRGGVNYAAWYVSVLLFGGILLYAVLRNTKQKVILPILTVFSLATILCIQIVYGNFDIFENFIPTIRGMADMSLGVVVYALQDKLQSSVFSKNKKVFNLLEIFVFASVLALLFVKLPLDWLVTLLIALLVLLMSNPNSVFSKFGELSVVKWLGKYEYAIYLNHAFVLAIFRIFVRPRIPEILPLQLFVIYVAVIVYSVITTEVISRMVNKLFKSK